MQYTQYINISAKTCHRFQFQSDKHLAHSPKSQKSFSDLLRFRSRFPLFWTWPCETFQQQNGWPEIGPLANRLWWARRCMKSAPRIVQTVAVWDQGGMSNDKILRLATWQWFKQITIPDTQSMEYLPTFTIKWPNVGKYTPYIRCLRMPWLGYRFSGRSWVAEFRDLGGKPRPPRVKTRKLQKYSGSNSILHGKFELSIIRPKFPVPKIIYNPKKKKGRKAHFPIALANAMFKVWGCIPDLLWLTVSYPCYSWQTVSHSVP